MARKNKLLSIGEISKLTGASLRSLRYYEKIGLLKPACTDPDSGYRYYTFDQTHHVELIMFCIELDIPLKELTTFTHADDMIDFRAFLAHGKEIAEQKLKRIKQGLNLICTLEHKMDLAEQYQVGQIYERELPQKFLHVKPCGASLKDLDLLELVASFADVSYAENEYDDLSEYGFLCEHTPAGAQYYAFLEVPKDRANKIIPAGTYLCRQSEDAQIEAVGGLFGERLTGDSWLAVEAEIFTGRHKISKPIGEIRVCRV